MGSGKHPDGVETIPATAEDLAAYERAKADLAAFRSPALVDSTRANDRLFVASFDGTGNSMLRDAPENHSNVAYIHQQVRER